MNVSPSGGSPTGRTFVMPQPGDVVAGKYTIVRVLGEGGMGVVYEATHQRLRQRVALKMLLPSMLAQEVLVTRFEREARAAAQLRGRHCARVMDVDVTPDGLPYIVMDFLEGHDLQVEIERRGRLPVPEAVDYVLQACAAMLEAHQLGIVHRDLKPSNLFLDRAQDGPLGTGADAYVVKVLDFGISKVATADEADSKLTDADAVMGTALYMSPEQVKASRSVDARADIWALGVILFEALSGRVPWMGSTAQVAAMIVTEDAPDVRTFCEVPAELAAIVQKCLQRDPNRRFADVKALASALAPFASQGGLGRNFADGILAMGAYPRLSLTVRSDIGAQSLPPAVGRDEEGATTLVNARGVGEETMRPRETGTVPGWSQRPPSPNTRRTVLFAVLAAFMFGLVAVGSIAFLLRKPRTASPTVVSESAPVAASAIVPASAAPAETSGEPILPAIEPVPPPTTKAEPSATGPLPSHPVPRVTAPARSGRTPSPPSPSPAPKASTPDKPLFL